MAKGNGGSRASSPGAPRGVVSGDSELKSFLLGYTPKSAGWTSKEEMDRITNKLGLEKMSNEELQSMRNKVVSIYNKAQDKEIKYDENGEFAGRTEKYWDYSEGMMSVTAVIDEVRRRKGTPISML